MNNTCVRSVACWAVEWESETFEEGGHRGSFTVLLDGGCLVFIIILWTVFICHAYSFVKCDLFHKEKKLNVLYLTKKRNNIKFCIWAIHFIIFTMNHIGIHLVAVVDNSIMKPNSQTQGIALKKIFFNLSIFLCQNILW